MPPRRTPSKKCSSCRRLKIKCDLKKPKCEYCESTNKKCIYGDGALSIAETNDIIRLSSGKLHYPKGNRLPKFNVIVQHQLTTSVTAQLKKQQFDKEVLDFFCSHYWSSSLYPNAFPPSVNKLVIPTVESSSRLRATVLALCGMGLYAMGPKKAAYVGDNFDSKFSPDYLYVKSLEYFQLSLKLNQEHIMGFLQGPRIRNVDDLLESLFSDVFTFLILLVQPFNLVPMIGEVKGLPMSSKNPFQAIPNIVAMCRGMKSMFGLTLVNLIAIKDQRIYPDSKYYEHVTNGTSLAKEIDDLLHLYRPPDLWFFSYEFRYPLPKMLLAQLDEWRKGSPRKADYDIYYHAVAALDSSIQVSMRHTTKIGLLRWIFLWDHEIFMFLEIQDFASLKLLFYFCSFCCFLDMKPDDSLSEPARYVETFKDISFKTFGRWHHEMDKDMYDLVRQGFKLTAGNIDILATFLPRDYVVRRDWPARIDSRSNSEEVTLPTTPSTSYDYSTQLKELGDDFTKV